MEQLTGRNNELNLSKRIENEQKDKTIEELEIRCGQLAQDNHQLSLKCQALEKDKISLQEEI